MDRTGKLAIALCFALIVFWGPITQTIWPPKPLPPRPKTAAGAVTPGATAPTPAAPVAPTAPGAPTVAPSEFISRLQGLSKQDFGTATLENDDMIVHFSGEGGGIKQVIFKKYDVPNEPQAAINDQAPTSSFDLAGIGGLEFGDEFKLESVAGSGQVVARRQTDSLSVTKTYRLGAGFQIQAEITLVNRTQGILSTAADRKAPLLAIGTASPLTHRDKGDYLAFGWLTEQNKFAKGGIYNVTSKPWYAFWATPQFVSFHKEVQAQWIAVNNQFFALVITPQSIPFLGIHAEAAPFDKSKLPHARSDQKGIFVFSDLGTPALAAGETRTLSFDVFAGPRDFKLLESLGKQQGYVMDYGMWAFFCKILLTMMVWFHGWLGNWGLAIIAMTVVIRLVFWPLTNASTRSMKRMQVLAPKMKEIQEKYRDDHEKLSKETWKLYADYGMTPLSPLGGCLPMLVQIPIFFALFSMLQSMVQLRGAEFLWIKDLSMPDTIFHIGGIPVNPMPLIMVAAQIWQMRIMPATTTDPSQKMMLWMMPMVFLMICYNFASALALYWTVTTVLQALQTYLVKNQPTEPLHKVKRSKFQGLTFGRPMEERKRK